MVIDPTIELALGGSIRAKSAAISPTAYQYFQMRNAAQVGGAINFVPDGVAGTGALSWCGLTKSAPVGGPTLNVQRTIPDLGVSATFDGVDDYFTSAPTGSPALLPLTIEAVLKLNAVPSAGQEAGIWGNALFGLSYKSDGKVYAYYDTVSLGSTTVATGSVVHLVLTRTAAGTVNFYVNGSLAVTGGVLSSLAPIGTFYCGKHWTNAHYLSATYSMVSLYGNEMSAAQAAASYAALAWTDVTSDTRGTVPLTIERGIRDDRPSSRVASTGFCRFALNNLASNSGGVTGYYSPGHASCRSGFTKGVTVRVSVGSDVLFLGRVRSIAPTPGKESGVLTVVTAADFMDDAATFKLDNLPILESVTGDTVFKAVVGAMPNQPPGIVTSRGSETYTLALDNTRGEEIVALQEFVRLANSELGYIYQRRTGELVYESRWTRPCDHGTAAVTLADTMHGLDVAEQASTSINRVQTTVHPRVIDAAATTVLFSLANALQLEAGETKTILGPYRTADAPGITTRVGGISMVTPVSTTDYTMNDASDGSGTDRTASLSVTANYGANGVQLVLTNNHTGRAYVTKMQCRGKGVYDFRTVVLRSEAPAGIAADGVNALTIDMVYQENVNVGQALADDLLDSYSDLTGTRAKSVTMLLGANGLPSNLHLYDISERISLSETITGANADYYINGVRLECQSGRLPVLKWWLAPAEFPMAMTAVAYNTSNFTASGGGSITVDSGDQITYAYAVRDKMMDLVVWLDTIDVTGTVSSISVAIPGGYVANRTVGLFGFINDAGTVRDANCRVAATGTVVTISRADGSNFTATASDNTTIRINARFEVQ